MPRIRVFRKAALLAAAAVSAILAAGPAAGQEAGLRGLLDDAPSDRTVTGATAYQPISPGAVPDEAEDDPFSVPSDDTFSDLEPVPPADGDAEADAAGQPAEANDADLEPYSPRAAALRASPADAVDTVETSEIPQRMNEREAPIEGLPLRREEDPFAPLGLRFGTFTVIPTLEHGLTWTSNADDSPDGEEALLSETTLRLSAASDWSRHRATANAFATYRKSVSGEEVSEIEGGGDASLELDLSRDLTARAFLGYSVRRESASSPVSIVGVEEQPLRHTIDGSLGLEKALGPLRLRVTGEVSRDQYGDAELAGGGTLSQSDRNSTLALVRLRGGYELSPALTPFIEVEAGHRFYDEERDSAGFARSATRLGARAGLTFDLSEKLRGEISAGWISEDPEDSRLEALSGPALAASLEWSPMRGTIVGLDAFTAVEGTTTAGESGSLLHSATLRIERQMRSNLTGSLSFGSAYRDYSGGGHDLILSGEAAFTWWLNRYAGLTARARHERQTSDLAGRDYETTSFFMGVKLQR